MALANTVIKPQARPLLGIMLMILTIMLFAFHDTLTKHLVKYYPVPFIIALRYWAFAALASAQGCRQPGGFARTIRSRRPVLQIMRGLILAVEMGLMALSFRYLKMVDAASIFAAAPLFVTALAGPILGEPVGVRRWAAVCIGFIGILIILRPGLTIFQPAALIPLSAAFGFALYVILTRIVSQSDESAATSFLYTGIVGAVASSVVLPFFWVSPTWIDWGLIILLAVIGSYSHLLLIKALELAPASTLQPFNYLMLVFAASLGYFLFDEIPDWPTIVGGVLITITGIYVIWRERERSRQPAAS